LKNINQSKSSSARFFRVVSLCDPIAASTSRWFVGDPDAALSVHFALEVLRARN